jgi:VIT1/CCC1 family predicted Fe2+/Mn2+ transporter
VSRFTNRTAFYSGSRQLVLGALAAGVTHLVGQLVGTGV